LKTLPKEPNFEVIDLGKPTTQFSKQSTAATQTERAADKQIKDHSVEIPYVIADNRTVLNAETLRE
jgi:hypothetical protein